MLHSGHNGGRSLRESAFLCLSTMRTIIYHPETPSLQMIDQRQLPAKLDVLQLNTIDEVIHAIRDMAVRGAPAIGITAAFALALAARLSDADDLEELKQDLEDAAQRLSEARPTAVNLRWAIDRMLGLATSFQDIALDSARDKMDQLAQRMADEDVEINRRMAAHGARLLEARATVIHHCNTGALAAVDYGTALGVIRYAHESGKSIHVLVDETRPRLQGARLTAWELEQYGISYDVICDSASGFFLQRGEVDAVFVGADRIAANGDVANKIGTYMLALAARDSGVPFYCVAPRSTFDPDVAQGADISIEQRQASEVLALRLGERPIAPEGASARNPAFDITPYRLVEAFVTEYGLIHPPFITNIPATFKEGQP